MVPSHVHVFLAIQILWGMTSHLMSFTRSAISANVSKSPKLTATTVCRFMGNHFTHTRRTMPSGSRPPVSLRISRSNQDGLQSPSIKSSNTLSNFLSSLSVYKEQIRSFNFFSLVSSSKTSEVKISAVCSSAFESSS